MMQRIIWLAIVTLEVVWCLAPNTTALCHVQYHYSPDEIHACTELDFNVCTGDGARRDAYIVDQYKLLVGQRPEISLQCVAAWKDVMCSAAFHWATEYPLVCKRSCRKFYRECLKFDIVGTNDPCGMPESFLPLDREDNEACDDYASVTACRECALNSDDARAVSLLRRSVRSSGANNSSCLRVVGIAAVASLLFSFY
jgi:hypothetical protein